jgi:antitoxin component YwqK of YwqJK toxin-antitoxin module
LKTAIIILFLLFCFTKTQAQSFELSNNGKDTVNRIDFYGYKQGKWNIKADYQNVSKIREGFQPGQTIETGLYLNNRKEGEWLEYYRNGKMRNKLTYVNGVLEGPAAFYATDGKILKEGGFKANKWIQ